SSVIPVHILSTAFPASVVFTSFQYTPLAVSAKDRLNQVVKITTRFLQSFSADFYSYIFQKEDKKSSLEAFNISERESEKKAGWLSGWTFFLSILSVSTIGFIVWRNQQTKIQNLQKALRNYQQFEKERVEKGDIELKAQRENLKAAIEETNNVINLALESGDFSTRIDLEKKDGSWKELAQSINSLFDSIAVPFQQINEIVGAMASSNLSIRYTSEAKGEVLKLSSSLNYALDSLSDLIKEIQKTTQNIGFASQEIQSSSQEMSTGTEEIAASTSELSNGAQEQVSRIDEASTTLESLLTSSGAIGEQAKTINTTSEQGVTQSNSGAKQVQQMDIKMKQMTTISSQTSESMEGLLTLSAEISGIVNAIREISTETNMLALNAAIEAAKAGYSGRGFAVVADQIRQLAEKSGTFTQDIETIISQVQTSIVTTSEIIEKMTNDITDSVAVSKQAGDSFTNLSDSYKHTLELSEKIVNDTDEQLAKVKQVVQLMESVVVIAEQAAAGTEEIASSANELSAGMNTNTKKTEEIVTFINNLSDKVTQFKLE
ncbi:MAG: methyl-accepting chemotaxis protein, partial [Bacteroidota bacterium]